MLFLTSMEEKDARFIHFWEKHKDRPWRFRLAIGGIFGFVMILVFAIKTVYFGDVHDSWSAYLGSNTFLLHIGFLGLISGWLYGWIMYKYCKRIYEKIKEKYHGRG